MKTIFRLSVFIMAATSLIACSDGFHPAAAEPCTDEQEVAVAVSQDPLPVFTWTPACGMASLQVFPTDGGPSTWVLYTGSNAEQNPLRSGVRYGVAPPETIEPAPATGLTAGTNYTVLVYRWIGEPGGELGSIFVRGSATFDR
jgi:hypothetical protein